MRVVLRQPETGFYFQPSGVWNLNRASARQFSSSISAYWWALDRGLQGAEVWLLLQNPDDDFSCITVESGWPRPVINCGHLEWSRELHWHLFNGLEADLLNFNPVTHQAPA